MPPPAAAFCVGHLLTRALVIPIAAALLLVGSACDAPQEASPLPDPAGPGEGWVDGGGLLVPPLGAVLTVSGADPDGRRVYTVTLGDELTCDRQREHDVAVEAANDRWLEDADHEALQQAIDDADRALFPPGTWTLRLDLGRRDDPSAALPLAEVRLFAERRTDGEPDAEFTAESPGVVEFEGSEGRIAAELGFGALWTGSAVTEGYFDFSVGFDALGCG